MNQANKTIRWVNFLHLYQPPTQSLEIVRMISEQSYAHILALLEKYPDLKLTLNISGSLIELLQRIEHTHILEDIKTFVQQNRIELVGSACYHPILPLIPAAEIKRQILKNEQILQDCFSTSYTRAGFYLPEMAYSDDVAKIVKELGFSWIIVDEITTREKTNPLIRYTLNEIGLDVVVRNTKVSKTFPVEYIVQHFDELSGKTIITAHDAELYGHWHTDDRGYYEQAFTHDAITFLTVSEYLAQLTTSENITLRASNWESTLEELAANIPYGLWNNPANAIHTKLWALANYAITTIADNSQNAHITGAQTTLSRGLASCSWWWASEQKIGPFSPVSWNPQEIIKGADELIESVRTLKHLNPDTYIQAEKLYTDLHESVWINHWRTHNL